MRIQQVNNQTASNQSRFTGAIKSDDIDKVNRAITYVRARSNELDYVYRWFKDVNINFLNPEIERQVITSLDEAGAKYIYIKKPIVKSDEFDQFVSRNIKKRK